MPSLRHEFLIDLFRENPLLIATLLKQLPDLNMPAFTSIEPVEGGLSDLPPEFRADLVLVFHFGNKAVWAVVLEVQLARDDDKRRVWPGYVGVARARYNCPACLTVVTLDAEVQRWAAQRIVDPPPWGISLRPVALGPGDYPAMDAAAVVHEPELAMISVLSREASPELVQVAEAALGGFAQLPEDRRRVYNEIIFALFREACKKGLLESQMLTQLMEKYRGHFRAFFDEGKDLGLKEGKDLGLKEGRTEKGAEDVLAVLQVRGLPVGPEEEQRIRSCDDPGLLSRWLVRAVTATSLPQVFQESEA